MQLFSSIVGFRRHGFMPCRLSKSSLLVFYFIEKREDEFNLLIRQVPYKIPVAFIKPFLSLTRVNNGLLLELCAFTIRQWSRVVFLDVQE